ncbi:MAG: hypothetical protein WB780_17190 [Candidatus Acidiferrales bacterium]
MVALVLIVSPAMAGTGGTGDATSGAANTNSAPAAKENAPAPATAAAPATPAPAGLDNQLQQLRDLLEAQSKQLQQQNEQMKDQQKKMQEMETQLKTVNANVAAMGLVNEGADPALATNPANATAINFAASPDDKDQPLSLHYKGITLTPGGFFAAESVYRNKGITNDVNTDFKGVPLPGQSASQLSDLNFSGRQSRISMKAEGKLSDVKLTGYYEADFLGAGVTSNNNQTNSYVYRQRQIWGQAAFDSGWKITGGQEWSLVTETRHGLDNLTEVLPLTIDAQYQVGFSWARQYGFRITKNIGDRFWVGMSVEGPQTTLGGKLLNDKSVPLTGTSNAAVSTTYSTTLIAAPGDLSGLYNNQANYSYNASPDFVFKAAWEPGFGHYELFGIVSTFKARVFPCAAANALNPCGSLTPNTANAALASNDTRTGGGFGGNASWSLFSKHLDFGLHAFGGDGTGRYGSAGLSDVTVRPDGTLVPIRNYQGMGTIILHPTPKLDLYGYAGGEYDARASYIAVRSVNTGTVAEPNIVNQNFGVGYGSPLNSNAGCLTESLPTNQNTPAALGSCQQDNRTIIEGTFGFWYRFYQGERGRMQFGMQYSYVTRNTWGANAGGSPHGIDNMFFTSFRYYIP